MQLHQKIIHLLAQLALLKYQSLQGGVQRARASKNVKNLSQPADVLKFREEPAAFFEANVLITAEVGSTHARSLSVIVANRLQSALPIRPGDLHASARLGCDSPGYAAEVYSFQKGL